MAGEQDPLAFILAQAVNDRAGTPFTAVLAVPNTKKVLSPAYEGAQRHADFAAGAHQAGASGSRLAKQLDCLPPVRCAGQTSASSEQKASHFFRSTSKAAISAMAFCSAIESTGLALAS